MDSNDLAAVYANYGLTHPKEHGGSAHKVSGVPDLYFDLSGVSIVPGANISIPIKFGTASLPMNPIYGLASGIEVMGNLNLYSPMIVNDSAGWIGNSSNTLDFNKTINNYHVDWAHARTDHSNINGSGTIATLNFTVHGPLYAGEKIKFHFQAPQVIDKDGNIITAYNALDDSLYVTLGISNVEAPMEYAEIVPNPSTNYAVLNVSMRQAGNVKVKIRDIVGRTVWEHEGALGNGNQSISLPSSVIVPGMYMIQIQGEGWQYDKVLKWVRE